MVITLETLAIHLVVGLVAGWLASELLRVRDLNFAGYIVVGVIGAFIGSWLFEKLDLTLAGVGSFIHTVISAFVGAVVLLLLLKLIRK